MVNQYTVFFFEIHIIIPVNDAKLSSSFRYISFNMHRRNEKMRNKKSDVISMNKIPGINKCSR